MAATVESYLALVTKAYDGRLQLPAFQRAWKWKSSQVTLLYDSLRQGFPIGGFLFIKRNPEINLSPREFRGAHSSAEHKEPEFLVLDGQQRITAGIELFYGSGTTQYFLDLNRIYDMCLEKKVDLESPKAIHKFLEDLDTDERYCIARKPVADPGQFLLTRHLLPTTYLANNDEMTRALRHYKKSYPDRQDFVDFVVDKNFRPSDSAQVPITSIDEGVTIEAISRIFSTLNSTGKILTPFELVVSILFPDVNLVDDVSVAKEAYPYYAKIDRDGDILLQTIALFSDKDTKKASLPKTITVSNYRVHSEEVCNHLNEAAKLLTDSLGLGLDQDSELLVYPVIFPPIAYVRKVSAQRFLTHEQRAVAERKVCRWFIGAVLSRRYQQSTHDKQARDKSEIPTWLEGGDDAEPQWLKDTFIPNLKNSDPDSAIGKLVRALVNSDGIKDPVTAKSVGVGSGRASSAKHHIFPTRFVRHLEGWDDKIDSNDVALNIMYCEQSTNASWLHIDPANQIKSAILSRGSESAVREIYRHHGINDKAFDIMIRPQKTRADFYAFIEERERYFVEALGNWGFRKAIGAAVLDDSDLNDE